MKVKSLLFYGISLLVCLSLCANAQLFVTVYNQTSDQPLDGLDYEDMTPFSMRSSNVTYLTGFLHIPVPNNACSLIRHLPDGINSSWFALVSDYPACPLDMVTNLRAAGYDLVIAHSNKSQSVSQGVRQTGFPVVVLPESYASLLEVYAAANVSLQDPLARVEVKTSLALSLSVVVIAFSACMLCCLLSMSAYCYYQRRRRIRRHRAEFAEYRARQRNYEQTQRGGRNARQELIESILRQLQEIQVDARSQVPLGAAETQQLPIRPFIAEESKTERCAICVEDFDDGEKLRWLPCEHCFHPECIDEWLNGHSSLCPLCKSPVRRERAQPVLFADTDTDDSDSPLLDSSSVSYGAV